MKSVIRVGTPPPVPTRALTVLGAVEGSFRSLADLADSNSRRLIRGQKKALHDLRVTVRRMRTLLRAYEGFLPPEMRPACANLKTVMHQTNQLRDLEVQEMMLSTMLTRKRLAAPTRNAISIIRNHVLNGLTSGRDSNQGTVETLLKHVKILLHIFDEHHTCIGTDRYLDMTASLVHEEITTFARMALSLKNRHQIKRLHKTRLSAKRLRYVMEPIPERVVGVRDGINRLKRLQNLLGAIRDTQTLAQTISTARNGPSLANHGEAANDALSVVSIQQDRLFATYLRRRAGGEITRLEHRIFRVVDGLRPI